MSIYQVNQVNAAPIFYVEDQATADSVATDNVFVGGVFVGTLQDAEAALKQTQQQFLVQEAERFSICANFYDGAGNTVWRALEPTDPEDTVCQVFNTFTGGYTEYQTVAEAKAANRAVQEEFLANAGLGSVVTLDAIPTRPKQPISTGAQTL